MRQRLMGLKLAVLLCDLAAGLGALVIATTLRYSDFWWKSWGKVSLGFPRFALLYLMTFLAVMYYFDTYRFEKFPGFGKMLPRLVKAHVLTLGFMFMFMGMLKVSGLSRLIVVAVVLIHFLLTFSFRILVREWLRFLSKNGNIRSYILVVGLNEQTHHFVDSALNHPEYGVKIVGILSDNPGPYGSEVLGVPVLGGVEDVGVVFKACPIDEVVFVQGRGVFDRYSQLISLCKLEGKSVHILIEGLTPERGEMVANRVYGLTALSSFPVKPSSAFLVKRGLDIVLSGVALASLSPLLLVIVLLIRITSPGPALFVQERIGYNGRRIKVFKFRTMVQNADAIKDQLRHLNEVDGPVFKIKDDPRITSVGRFLRKTSLDELPQLINVLLGHMSIVGPRPLPTKEALQCTGWQRKRMAAMPGLTCIWQISGRNGITFEEWMKMDIEYIEKWSLWMDFKIIIKTVPEVLGMHGM